MDAEDYFHLEEAQAPIPAALSCFEYSPSFYPTTEPIYLAHLLKEYALSHGSNKSDAAFHCMVPAYSSSNL